MNIHKVLIVKNTYDIVSADTDFYAFIGDRLYYTFNRLVARSDRELFQEHCRSCAGERFLLSLLNDTGMISYFFAKITPGMSKDHCLIELINIAELIEQEVSLRQELLVKNAMLELYNDSYFKYTPLNDMVEYHMLEKGSRVVKSLSFEQAVLRVAERTEGRFEEELARFVSCVRNGVRNFAIQFQGDLLGERSEVVVTAIQGKSIYENGTLLAVVGYIHFGSDQNRNINKPRELDGLTGVLTKAEITNLAMNLIDKQKRKDIAIAIVDVDYFKKANDTFGHMCGDEILKKIAAIMEEEVGEDGVVGRIGGDEFFIVFYDADDLEKRRERLRSIKNRVKANFSGNEKGKPRITLSIGCAAYPKDADNYADLFKLADFAVYRAKERGRDRYIIYHKDKHGSLETIQQMKMGGNAIDSRGNMSKGDILCVLMDKVYHETDYSLNQLLRDAAMNLGIQRIVLYGGEDSEYIKVAGEAVIEPAVLEETKDYINDDIYRSFFNRNGCLVNTNIISLEERCWPAFLALQRQEVQALIQLKCQDCKGRACVLSLESVDSAVTWNESYMHLYRLLAKLVEKYDITE